jgi:ribosomal protein L27
LQNGQILLLNGVEQGNVGAKAGGNWAHFAQRKLVRKSKKIPDQKLETLEGSFIVCACGARFKTRKRKVSGPPPRDSTYERRLVSGGLFNGMAGEIFAKSRGELLQAGVNILVHGFDHSLHSFSLGWLIVFVLTRPNGGACFGIE